MKAMVPIAIVLSLAAAVLAQQRWYDLYDQALEHVSRADWEPAEAKLRQAKAAGPPPGRSVLRYGMFRPPFFPDFYLGVVFLNTQRPAEALRSFALARAQKIDTNNREFQAIAEYETQAKILEERLAKADAIVPPAIKPVPVESTPPEKVIADKATVPVDPGKPPDGTRDTGVDAVAAERQRLRHNAEREAMQSFFAGRYGETVTVLNKVERDIGAPLSARGYFYRACALAAQALRSSQVNSALMEEARSQYARSVREGAVPAAERRYVSPRVLRALGS